MQMTLMGWHVKPELIIMTKSIISGIMPVAEKTSTLS